LPPVKVVEATGDVIKTLASAEAEIAITTSGVVKNILTDTWRGMVKRNVVVG